MRRTKLAYALVFTPLLMGADHVGQKVEELKVTTLSPSSCGDGEYLVFRGGALKCEKVSSSGPGIALQTCTAQLLTNMSGGSDVPSLSCTPKGGGSISVTDAQTVTRILNDLTTIETTITTLEGKAPPAGAVYVGSSTT